MAATAAATPGQDVPGPDILSGIKNRRLHQNQLKYCEKVLVPTLLKMPDAWPFQKPVDPVALNLPDYHDIVKHPMDLGTVKAKLARLEYQTTDECLRDIDLVFGNCRLYNKPGSDIVLMCDSVERAYRKLAANIPKDGHGPIDLPKDFEISGVTPDRRASKVSVTGTKGKKTEGKKAGTIVLTKTASPSKKGGRPKSEPIVGGITLNHADGTTNGTAVDTEDGKKPRRKSIKPEHLTFEPSKKVKLGPQLKFCLNLVKEFYAKKHAKYAWPFYQPVDPVALGLPDYFTIIQKPMDLSTVRKKLEGGAYRTANEYAEDMRLIFTNCYRYNPAGTEVFEAGRELHNVFETKFALLPDEDDEEEEDEDSQDEVNEEEEEEEGVTDADDELDNDEEEDPEAVARKHKLEELQVMVQMLQGSIAELSKSSKPASRRVSTVAKGKERRPTVSGTGSLLPGTPLDRRGSTVERKPSLERRQSTGSQKVTKQRTMSTSSVTSGLPQKRKKKLSRGSKKKKHKHEASEHMTEDHSMATAPRTKKTKDRVMDPRPMSFEEKRRLSCAINRLAPDKIPALVNIIQERIPPLKHCPAEELEIDIDSLDPLTLRMLDNYVKEVTEPGKKPRAQGKGKGEGAKGGSGVAKDGMADLVAEAQRQRRGRSPSDSSSSSSSSSSDSSSDSDSSSGLDLSGSEST
eukprot:comp22144_c1_seq1/m.32428 comp22144_c1_seq1/g.32428  ORF comp22144_c1_seq1/g.32428 comp22144_c1_seq1/m.32428 type:complete len:687 (-) comp22144_c1_seq1:339-2399(-)